MLHHLWNPAAHAAWPDALKGVLGMTPGERSTLLGGESEETTESALARLKPGTLAHALLDLQAYLSKLRQTTYARRVPLADGKCVPSLT